MRIRSILMAAALVPSALFAVAATPEGCTILEAKDEGEADDILVCKQVNYLSCENTLDPAGKLHDITIPVPLTLTPPATSFTAAGGCGVPEVPLFSGTIQDTPYDFDIAGTVEGNIDSLTFELHDIHATRARQTGKMVLSVRITIDGQSPFGSETNTNVSGDPFESPKTLDIPVDLVPSTTRLSDGMFFTVTNIGKDLASLLEAGTGQFHSIAVTIGYDALDSTGLQVPVWGATEVRASITLNGEAKGTIINATTIN